MKSICFAVAFCAAVQGVFPQTTDSVRTFRLPEIVVTATRSPISTKDSPSPIEVLNADDIERLNIVTVADVFRRSQGVFLLEYGAHAALKTASLRGTATQHLLVLLNGTRLNNFQNNLIDFSLLPVEGIEQIEILRGGSSALYGADALGGVVNILTRGTRKTRVRTEASLGSYGYRHYLVEGGTRIGSFEVLGGAGMEEGKDEYPFALQTTSGDIKGTRGNAGFRKRHLYVHAANNDEWSRSMIAARIVKAERGVPGSVTFPTQFARQEDENIIVTADYHHSHSPETGFLLRTGFTYGLQRYDDPDPFFPQHSSYKNNSLTVNPQFQFAVFDRNKLLLGAELVDGTLEAQDFGGTVRRVQKSLYLSNETSIEFDQDVADRLLVFGAARYDHVSDAGDAFSPKIGFNLRLTKASDARVRGSAGKSFHAPSFNDLYYPGFSNPELKPERSTSFDLGFLSEWTVIGIRQSSEVTYFTLDTKNRILFDLTTFMPRNIGYSRSSGLELRNQATLWEGVLEVGGTYSLVETIDKTAPGSPTYGKQLPFIPKRSGGLWISVRLSPWTANVTHTFAGVRYTTTDNSSHLAPFGLTNVNVAYRLTLGTAASYAKLEMSNILNKDYQVFPAYPMPRRTFRATFGFEL